ncbi:hypothetical protein KIN20_009574 [Parelaphostrongylus tenuis]|uniref:Uncharacterized protein n=1 Tax=Parelaphostrongylus tenuis TaxID=148309 RepID=A0AAD5QKQ3_PARTN|nr:hypothetical protein KIN20_009574 [Parelaphostrongylus tenuis]
MCSNPWPKNPGNLSNRDEKRARMSTVGRSLGAHDVVQFQSESPFSSDGSLSRAEMEQRDYALAKKLQEEEDRAHCLEERTVNSAETEDGGNIGSLLRSRRQLNPQRQPLPNNDQEVYSDDWSPASPNWEETDNDDSDVSIESRMSEESLISENDWSEAEIPEGSEVESGRDEDEGDEEEFNEEDDMENLR